jgi:hypothetical protein
MTRFVPLTGNGTLLPELLDRLIINGVPHLDQKNTGEFLIVEPVIEGFEPIELLPDGVRNPGGPGEDHHLYLPREQPEHPPLPEAAVERAHGVRMGGGFPRALCGHAILKEEPRADHLIAPLGWIGEAQLQLGKLRGRFHAHPSHPYADRGAYVADRTEAVTQAGRT